MVSVMTLNWKPNHLLVNVIIATLYLVCAGAEGGSGDGPRRQDFLSNDARTPHFGHISPIDPYPLVGETVLLNCTVLPTYPGPKDVSNLHFRTKDNEPIRNSETVILSNDTIQLIWYNVTSDQNGYVYCYMGHDILNGTNVNIGGKNGTLSQTVIGLSVNCKDPVPEPKYMYCVTSDGCEMNCSWCPLCENPPQTRWNMTWEIKDLNVWGICPKFEYPDMRCKCMFNCKEGDRVVSDVNYTITIFTENTFGSNTTTFVIDTNTIVKPNKVDDLKVTVLSSTSVMVAWKRPRDLPVSVAVHYELKYTSKWGNDTVDIIGPGVEVPVEHILKDLHPHTQYEISVRCKPRLDGYWSELATLKETTFESAPSAAPEMVEGSYKMSPTCRPNYSKSCDVIVMWKQIEEFHRNGLILKHSLEMMSSNGKISRELLSGDEFQATVSTLPTETYTATVRGYTSKGASPASNIMVSYTPEIMPLNVVAEIGEDEHTVDIWWDKPSLADITSYTLFYCTQGGDVNQPVCGPGDLTSVAVDANSTYASLPYNTKYRYNLAANTHLASSGMQDWLCLYNYDQNIPDANFIFTQHQSERSLTIEITTDQSCQTDNPSGRILNYNLSLVCVQNQNSSCPEAISYVVSWKTKNFIFPNLEPFKEYNVTVTAFGNSDSSTKTLTSRTRESAPDSPPGNVTVQGCGCHWINVSWNDPPVEDWNSALLMYHISYKGDDSRWLHANTSQTWLVLTDEIYGYVNYEINVTAANNGGYSTPAPSMYALTNMCSPSKVAVDTAQELNKSQVQITWEAPEHSNGRLEGYHILASFYDSISGLQITQSWNSSADMVPDKFVIDCPDNVDGYISVNYSVRAVTCDHTAGKCYKGPFSSSASSENKRMCGPDLFHDNLPLAIGVSVACAVVIVIVLAIAITCRQKWYADFKIWLGVGRPEDPPVIPDEKDELNTISSDPSYIDDLVTNWLFDSIHSIPLIPEENESSPRGMEGSDSGDSLNSPIFITSPEDQGSGESVSDYQRAQPDMIPNDSLHPEGGESIGYTNPAFIDPEEKSESGIHSGKNSDSDSKTSCPCSIDQEQKATPNEPQTLSLFSSFNINPAELDDNSSDDGYQEVGMKPHSPCNFNECDNEDVTLNTSARSDDGVDLSSSWASNGIGSKEIANPAMISFVGGSLPPGDLETGDTSYQNVDMTSCSHNNRAQFDGVAFEDPAAGTFVRSNNKVSQL